VTAQDVQDPPVWDGPPTTGHCPICGDRLRPGWHCPHTDTPPARPEVTP
jgi:hypothetical protein